MRHVSNKKVFQQEISQAKDKAFLLDDSDKISDKIEKLHFLKQVMVYNYSCVCYSSSVTINRCFSQKNRKMVRWGPRVT
jgi:hypothetical protein